MKISEKKYKKKSSKTIRKAKFFLNNFFYCLKIALVIIIIALFLQIYFGKSDNYLNKYIRNYFVTYSLKYGFVLQNVFLEGQDYTSSQDILKALGIKIGDPILLISVKEIKNNLEKLEWIKVAVVDREFPGNIYIGISERVPIGIGQYNKKLFLFDKEGKMINQKDLTPFLHLPVVISEDLGLYINNLYNIIRKDEALFKKITSVIRVSERRWNIRFQGDMEVKLPEYKIEETWNKLITLNKNNQLFNENILSIDLRVPSKIFVEKK